MPKSMSTARLIVTLMGLSPIKGKKMIVKPSCPMDSLRHIIPEDVINVQEMSVSDMGNPEVTVITFADRSMVQFVKPFAKNGRVTIVLEGLGFLPIPAI